MLVTHHSKAGEVQIQKKPMHYLGESTCYLSYTHKSELIFRK